ncbi:hypothetical protein [Deinococcus hopiensis]|uniref:Uncharacterized protein n=1 Tax=Deinococcus hopiensis KR-140 TaxID=695939 RepID=A0A1W1VIF3_9DEIO|nr:hypothetical protein [Deinococcus hopiensis]SMB93063.1 hypothetical protein SAMN00790413_01829 [Deinococcus hopiensis KR-140]
MSFVRKPRPYSSGLPAVTASPVPAVKPSRVRREKRPRPAPAPAPRRPGSSWATAVTALAVLGTVLVTLVGAAGLVGQVSRDAQFLSAAAGVTDVVR